MQPSQNTMVVSASNISYSTNQTEFTQQISDEIKQQIRSGFDDQFRNMKTTMTATQIEAAEAKTLATDVAKQLTDKQQEVIVTIATLQQGIDAIFLEQETTSTEMNRLLERLVSAANISSQQQQSFHYQPQSFYRQPKPLNPYYMPPVSHLLPDQQQQANQIAHLGGSNEFHIHNGNNVCIAHPCVTFSVLEHSNHTCIIFPHPVSSIDTNQDNRTGGAYLCCAIAYFTGGAIITSRNIFTHSCYRCIYSPSAWFAFIWFGNSRSFPIYP